MEVHRSEGVAIRADLESCVVIREGDNAPDTEPGARVTGAGACTSSSKGQEGG